MNTQDLKRILIKSCIASLHGLGIKDADERSMMEGMQRKHCIRRLRSMLGKRPDTDLAIKELLDELGATESD